MKKSSFQRQWSVSPTAIAIAVALFCHAAIPAFAQTSIDEWSTVQAPKPPELKAVTLDPKTTALLVLDFVKQTCNAERRPRCLTSVPKAQGLLKLARDYGLAVLHSVTTASTPADIAKELTPAAGEPIVKAPADKFFRTALEKILTEKGVKTVVIVGTAAQDAALNIASQAAFRGLRVIQDKSYERERRKNHR